MSKHSTSKSFESHSPDIVKDLTAQLEAVTGERDVLKEASINLIAKLPRCNYGSQAYDDVLSAFRITTKIGCDELAALAQTKGE